MGYAQDAGVGGGLDSFSGFHVRKPEYEHRTQFLVFDKGESIFRIMPAMMEGQELPMRWSERDSDFTPWIAARRMVIKCGVNKVFTCFCHVKGKDPRELGPVDHFTTTIHRVLKKNAREYPVDWENWSKHISGMGVRLPRPDIVGLLQGVLFTLSGKPLVDKYGQQAPQYPVLLVLKRSGRESLETLAGTEVAGYTGNPEDWSRRYVSGDLVSSANGSVVEFGSRSASAANGFAGYTVRSLNTPVPLSPEVTSRWVPWDNLLEYLTEEQQLGLVAGAFPADVVDFAFRGTPWYDMLPSNVRGSWDVSVRESQLRSAGAGMFNAPGAPAYPNTPVAPVAYQMPTPQPQYSVPAAPASPAPAMFQQVPVVPQAPVTGVDFSARLRQMQVGQQAQQLPQAQLPQVQVPQVQQTAKVSDAVFQFTIPGSTIPASVPSLTPSTAVIPPSAGVPVMPAVIPATTPAPAAPESSSAPLSGTAIASEAAKQTLDRMRAASQKFKI